MSEVEFSFDSPKTKVDVDALTAAIGAGDTQTQEQAAVEAKPEAEAALAATTPEQDATKPSTSPQPQGDELRTHKITVDGQELEVTEADLKAGHMRLRDYTQKTQRIAEDKRAIEAERTQWKQEKEAISQELAAIDQFLRDQSAVKSYMEKAFGVAALSTTPPPQVDPNKPLTARDVAEIAAYNAEQVRLATQRDIALARQEALRATQIAENGHKQVAREKAGAQIDDQIRVLLDKHPVLKKFEGIEDELINDAIKYQPKSVDEAKQRLQEAAERRVATLKAINEESGKQAAAEAARLKKNSTEPVGGTAPRQEPAKKVSLRTEDRRALLQAAEDDLRSFLGQS